MNPGPRRSHRDHPSHRGRPQARAGPRPAQRPAAAADRTSVGAAKTRPALQVRRRGSRGRRRGRWHHVPGPPPGPAGPARSFRPSARPRRRWSTAAHRGGFGCGDRAAAGVAQMAAGGDRGSHPRSWRGRLLLLQPAGQGGAARGEGRAGLPDPFTPPLGPVDNNPPVARTAPPRPAGRRPAAAARPPTPAGGAAPPEPRAVAAEARPLPPPRRPAAGGGKTPAAPTPGGGGGQPAQTPAGGATPATAPPAAAAGVVAQVGGPAEASACDRSSSTPSSPPARPRPRLSPRSWT